MAGGGGSAAWLCWLGRARVVPTAAAEEHTVQDHNHTFVQNYETNIFFHLNLLVSIYADSFGFTQSSQ